MPLSPIDGCTAEHWDDVQAIIKESVSSISDPVFATRMVSDADEVGVIQKRIVQNIFLSDVVVCDVSGRNPNVMFELGMRLAFDRPAVIIKDDKTPYSFDTSVIEHLTYPRDLRYGTMVSFRQQLADKVLNTYNKAMTDANHTTFLKNFGTFKVASLHTEEVKSDEIILSTLDQVQAQVNRLSVKIDRLPQNEPMRGGVDMLTSKIRREVREHKTRMDPDTWNQAINDPEFVKFIVSKFQADATDKDIPLMVRRAIDHIGRS